MEIDGLPSTVMPPPAVTLTFGLLTPKSNQHTNRNVSVTPKFGEIPFIGFFEIWRYIGFRDIACCDLDL